MAGSSGFRGTSSLLMVVAVAAMAGFLYWVYQEAQSVESSLQPEMDRDTASATSTPLTAASLAADPGGAVGRSAALDSVEVSQSLGRGVFTVSLNDTVTYPILMDGQLLQRGATVYGGDRVTVEGRFYTLNDSIIQEWMDRGALDAESRGDLPAIVSFMLADSLDIQE